MSDESQQSRSEPASPHKLEKAREKGQIAYSTDLTSGISLLLCSVFLAVFGEVAIKRMVTATGAHVFNLQNVQNENAWQILCVDTSIAFIVATIPLVSIAFIATALSGFLLTGFHPSPKALRVDFEKLHPKNGVKRIFSSRSVVRGVFSILKLAALTGIVIWILGMSITDMRNINALNLPTIILFGWDTIVRMSLGLSAALVAIGLFDLLYQKWKHLQEMKMTRQEVKDERKEAEVDPMIKARIKKVQREVAQRRMLQDVPTSTVVLTNPTHFAVAIQYDRDTMPTPKVVAKGTDHLAKKIIRIAEEHGVAVVERKPLARFLYKNTEIGDEIPQEAYQIVAEVLAFVYRSNSAA